MKLTTIIFHLYALGLSEKQSFEMIYATGVLDPKNKKFLKALIKVIYNRIKKG